ncbi:MAG: flavodoxin [Anaerorhabdus sp.]
MAKTLIAYFSFSNNTKQVAQMLQEILDADLFRIEQTHTYPDDYNRLIDVAAQEKRNNDRPALTQTLDNLDDVDTIFILYPNWWATAPMPVFTFLESYNFNQKKIYPLCTHEGSGLGTSVADIKKIAPEAIVNSGLALRGSRVATEKGSLAKWALQSKSL